jgi:hypothetical protein
MRKSSMMNKDSLNLSLNFPSSNPKGMLRFTALRVATPEFTLSPEDSNHAYI